MNIRNERRRNNGEYIIIIKYVKGLRTMFSIPEN